MKAFQPYWIEFVCPGDDQTRIEKFEAASPTHAFARCLKKYPEAQLLKGWREGFLAGWPVSIEYDVPPSTAKVEAEPEPKAEEIKFPFWDGCLGKGRLTELTS
jgi:hypothetical protein